jgi:hypothetical protein
MTEEVIVARRFRGPPASGNGGYCCGLLAQRMAGAVEVTLRAPPPLDRALGIDCDASGCALRDGAQVIGQARATALDLELREPPSLAHAERCVQRFTGFSAHVFPECFTCGPARAEGDGLRIFTGPSDDGSYVAAPWVPHASLAEHGVVPAPIVWAALDCPGYFAAASGLNALLGRMTAELVRLPKAGEACVVMGWALGREGRKIHAATALFDERGGLLGSARQTWIALETQASSLTT